jgi:hypothetical protein
MGSNSRSLSLELLHEISTLDPEMLLLHPDYDHSILDSTSDIDIVTRQNPLQLVRGILEKESRRYSLVMLNPYDLNSLATFWIDIDNNSWVQIDMLCDPDGRGRYGLRTTELIDESIQGRFFRMLNEDHFILYRNIKDYIKLSKDIPNNFGSILESNKHLVSFRILKKLSPRSLSNLNLLEQLNQFIKHGLRLYSKLDCPPGFSLQTLEPEKLKEKICGFFPEVRIMRNSFLFNILKNILFLKPTLILLEVNIVKEEEFSVPLHILFMQRESYLKNKVFR